MLKQWLSAKLVLCFFALTAGCVSLPPNLGRTESFALTDTGGTRLGQSVSSVTALHPDKVGLHPILSGVDALVARLTLADAAQRSLDVQYYIFDPDTVGKLLAERLLAAADRGVRVRILLDDIGAAAKDDHFLALASHPNIEIRLFNPIALRGNRALGMFFEFSRTTRRMHNKSFTADNQVTIIGGRNVANEYYQANPGLDYADLDAIAVGPVVKEVSGSFDLFWNSLASYPISALNKNAVAPEALSKIRAELASHLEAMKDSAYEQALRQSRLLDQLNSGDVLFYWGEASLVYDHPNKAATQSNDSADRLLPKLRHVVDATKQQLQAVSPYFVPGRAGVKFFEELRARGVRVVILTNSLASSDVLPVYAAYSRYRMELLHAGVELYELKSTAPLRRSEKSDDRLNSSSASLHAKSFVFDRQSIFVGSLNMDPRSAHLNTEIGVVFESQELATRIAEDLDARLNEIAWHVEVVPVPGSFWNSVCLNWVTTENGSIVRLTSEPGRTFWRDLMVGLLRCLPIEDQL